MPRPRERVYTLDKQKKHLARLSLLSAKRFRFNAAVHRPLPVASARLATVRCDGLFAVLIGDRL